MRLGRDGTTQIAMLALMTFSLSVCASTHGGVNDGATMQRSNKEGDACEQESRQSGYDGGGKGMANRPGASPRCLSASGWARQGQPQRETVNPLTDQENKTVIATVGRADTGKMIFNGTGACFSCHGLSGEIREIPHYSAAAVAKLNPPPSDLRNPRSLRLTTNAQRFRAIKYGIRGTAMIAMTHLSDAEIFDVLAYLETLRTNPLPGERGYAEVVSVTIGFNRNKDGLDLLAPLDR